ADQPAALDPLERPEPVGRLVAGPHRVPVLNEARPPSFRRPALPCPCRRGRAELVEDVARRIAAEGVPAVLGPPLADDPRVAGHVVVAGYEERRQVVPAQEPRGREGEPGVDDKG